MLFVSVYFARTHWIAPGMDRFTYGHAPFPFRYRLLVPAIARFLASCGIPLEWAYGITGTLGVFGLLLVYDRFLAKYMRRDLARVLALGILYPLGWNFLGLNKMNFPFDLPGTCLFTLALLLLHDRKWALYYPVFVLATLNRETSWLLGVICLFAWWRRMPTVPLLLHVAAQAAIWIGLKRLLFVLMPGGELYLHMEQTNLSTWTNMLTLHDTGPKDWTKLVLMFGGMWLLVPVLWKETPEFFRRALLTIPLFLAPLWIVGTIDEARVYAELIPLFATAPILWLAHRLEPARSGA
jgi:hypothetical protein